MNYGGTYSGFHAPKLTRVNRVIIIIYVALFLIHSILGHLKMVYLPAFLGLSSPMVFRGFIYQLITYPLMGIGLIEVLFSSLILWFVGSELESSWGERRYSGFIFFSTICGGIIYILITSIFFSKSAIINVPLTGLAGMTNSLLLAYAIIYPYRTFAFMLIFPVKAKYFCMILIAMQLYIGFFSPAAALAWGHLGAMGCGFVFMILLSSPRTKPFVQALGALFAARRKRKKSNLTLVKGNDSQRPPKYWQ